MTHTTPICCPTCFESFEIVAPPAQEVPCEVDYDCEVCCRPMRVHFELEPGDFAPEVIAHASGLAD